MAPKAHFNQTFLDFLDDLKANNNRVWFQANKERFHTCVRDPMLRFIADFQPYLHEISPAFVADPRSNGGSMFRIYRDTRFSKDKTPYKTHAAVHFRHEDARDVHCPGFYLHIGPDEIFAGTGIWHPDGPSLTRIRAAIDEAPDAWRAAVHEGSLARCAELTGDSLKRPPRGYGPDHPLVTDLKRKDFVAGVQLRVDQLFAEDFIVQYAQLCSDVSPLPRFLTHALGVRW